VDRGGGRLCRVRRHIKTGNGSVDSCGCISVELRRTVENEIQNGNRDRGGKAHVSPKNRIAGLKILTSKEVSYMRELAPKARSARGEAIEE